VHVVDQPGENPLSPVSGPFQEMGGSGLEVGVLRNSIFKPASRSVIPSARQLLLGPCQVLRFARSEVPW
jgi:hypothetical protein